MFPPHVLTPAALAGKIIHLLPAYLPGTDTGAFEPTDRRRCWNKTLTAILTAMATEDPSLRVDAQSPMMAVLKDQASILWLHDEAPVFAMTTGWGDRDELDKSLVWLEAFKCPQKLFVYSCSKWRDAVLDQICARLLRYPYHMEGEQYLFMNLTGAESRFDLQVVDLRRSGLQLSKYDTMPRPVTGSPFSWITKRNPHPDVSGRTENRR